MRPPEVVMLDLVRQWLAKAEDDLAVAAHLVAVGNPYLSAVGFHTQQAAEKFLKAVLVRHQVEFQKTRELEEILDLIETVEPRLAQSLRDAEELTPYGLDILYPGDIPEMTMESAQNAVALAARVREAVRLALEDYLAGSSP